MRSQGAQAATFRRPGLLREILFVGLGYLIYSQVRGLAGDRVIDAFANGYRIVDIESRLGIFEELAVQAWLRPHDALVEAFNVIYFYGLFPLLVPTAIGLFIFRPQIYLLARNAFLISGAIAVCFFLVLPTAPPRLIGMGFIDTLGHITPTYSSIPGVNHFAALPSMHVGWNFLTSIALYLGLAGVRGRAAILALPPVMLFATVATGNHYFLDGVLGMIVAAIALLIAIKLQARSEGISLRAKLRALGSNQPGRMLLEPSQTAELSREPLPTGSPPAPGPRADG
jgi:membrane-associated phospholipid phosphatase